jgi:hypothetical protein
MSEPVVLNAIILFVGVPAPILILCALFAWWRRRLKRDGIDEQSAAEIMGKDPARGTLMWFGALPPEQPRKPRPSKNPRRLSGGNERG